MPYDRLRARAGGADRPRRSCIPVFFGSAITGAGVDALMAGIAELLPGGEGDADGPVSGTRVQDRARARPARRSPTSACSRERSERETGSAFGRGREAQGHGDPRVRTRRRASSARRSSAGQIAKLWGLGDVRIGDAIGDRARDRRSTTSLRRRWRRSSCPAEADEKAPLHAALAQLAEQDPLINLRQDDVRQELSVSLYGEVQKEVIEATLANDYGIEVEFRETTTICIERPAGIGDGRRGDRQAGNPVPRHGRAARRAGADRHRHRRSGSTRRWIPCRSTSTAPWTRSVRRWKTPSGTHFAKASRAGR